MSTVTLISSDGQEFVVDKKLAEMSVTIKELLSDLSEGAEESVPLPTVEGKVLAKVVEYSTQHLDAKEVNDYRKEEIPEWDQDFMNVDRDLLFAIIEAANYLNLQSLMNLGCQTVANMIKGKKTEEIRQMFGIENDFTPEEEEAVRQETAWLESA